jgi:hypothetical protein
VNDWLKHSVENMICRRDVDSTLLAVDAQARANAPQRFQYRDSVLQNVLGIPAIEERKLQRNGEQRVEAE